MEGHYNARGGDFRRDEESYRRGFAAALDTNWRGRSYKEAAPDLNKLFSENCGESAFRLGHERGLGYYKKLREKHNT